MVKQDPKGFREARDLRVLMVKKDLRVLLGHREQKDLRVLKVLKE
jgi:hypothetical protein